MGQDWSLYSNATRPREKTVDDSWSKGQPDFKECLTYFIRPGKMEMISVHLWSWTRFRRPTLSAYKLLQLLRRLTGWAMMAADDIHWSWVERQHPPTDSRRGLVFSAAPAGKSRRPALPRAARRFSLQTQLLSTSSMDYKYNDDGDDDGDSTETWSLDF